MDFSQAKAFDDSTVVRFSPLAEPVIVDPAGISLELSCHAKEGFAEVGVGLVFAGLDDL
jgi:hypothetical protein